MHTRFIELAGEINTAMPHLRRRRVIADALNDRGKPVKGSRVLVLGMAYKHDVDDCRESPAVELMELLQERGAVVSYNDPHVPELPPLRGTPSALESVPLTAETLEGQDCVLIATDHKCFDWAFVAAAFGPGRRHPGRHPPRRREGPGDRHLRVRGAAETGNGRFVALRRADPFLQTGTVHESTSRSSWTLSLREQAPSGTTRASGAQGMRVFITGGAGFIGSHLSDAYLARGDEVFVLDDLSTGSIDNIRHLRQHPRFHYQIESVHHQAVVAELVDQCDVVFHLAAAVGVKLIVESPVRTIETNVHGTEVVLAQANKKKKKVLIASTSEVYGLSNQVPFREDGNLVMGATTKGRWSYACSKAIDEFLALAYWREKKLPTVVVRLFNTVGPRQTGQYGMVIPTFVKQALAGRPITVYGDGSQTRCFGHVGEVVGALVALMDHPDAVGQVFNIGSDGGGDDQGGGRAGPGADRLSLRDRHRPLRRGLRGGF